MLQASLKDWKVTDKGIAVTLEVANSTENREKLAAMYITCPLSVEEMQTSLGFEEDEK
jgi:hypothetical protein